MNLLNNIKRPKVSDAPKAPKKTSVLENKNKINELYNMCDVLCPNAASRQNKNNASYILSKTCKNN